MKIKNLIRNKFPKYFFDESYISQKKLLFSKEDPIIFDVGANRGQSTDKYVRLFENARIFAFEPFKDAYKSYLNRFNNHSQIKAYNLALSDVASTTDFYCNNLDYTNSLLRPMPADERFTHEVDSQMTLSKIVKIKTQSLDDFVNVNRLSSIDILKLDTQGSELKVLKGAKKMLRSGKISIIFCEVEFVPLYKDQPLFCDIQLYLKTLGFSLFNLFNLYTEKENNRLITADALFIRSKHAF